MKNSPYFHTSAEIPAKGYGPLVVDCRHSNKPIVHLNVAKVVSDPDWYPRSPAVLSYQHDLPFNGDERRIRQLVELIQAKAELPPVQVFLSCRRDRICYPDGRHRIMLLHAAGYASVPAEVPQGDVEVIQRLIGCERPDARIQVLLPSPL